MTGLFVQLNEPLATDVDPQQLTGSAGLVVDGRCVRPGHCQHLAAPVVALTGGAGALAEWCDEGDPLRVVDGDLEACARLRDAQPEFAWLPRLVAYRPEVVYRMSDYLGEGFRFYAPDTAAIRGYRVDDGDRSLAQTLVHARSLGFDQLWLHARDAARRGDGLDLDLLEQARRHFGDGVWLSGGATSPQHLANLAREGGTGSVVVGLRLLAEANAETLTRSLLPPPPPEQPIHFNLPRG